MDLDFLGWVERFIATPSVSRDGNRDISELACALLREIGLEPTVCEAGTPGPPQRNVMADAGPVAGDDGLLLLTHLDTVPPGDVERWTATGGDPYRPTRCGERLYGLGSADAKVDFVCKAAALAALGPSRLGMRVRIVGTFGEEIGLLGARQLLASGGTRGFRYALVGEPSEGVAMIAHKGYAVFRARLPAASREPESRGASAAPPDPIREEYTGVSAHSSTPALGRNAIALALDRIAAGEVAGIADLAGGGAVNQVPERCRLELWPASPGQRQAPFGYPAQPLVAFQRAWRDFEAALGLERDPRFDPDHSVASLGRVAFEEGRPSFEFDVRPVPGVDPERAVAALAGVAEIECLRRNPPLATPEDAPLVEAVVRAQRACGADRRIGTKATCTEAGLLAEAGLQVVVMGAGPSIGNVHRPNEYTRLPELGHMRDVYTHLCGGGI